MSLIGQTDEKEEECYNKMWELDIDVELKEKIEEMPKEIQKKLYIYTMRFYWRDYIPLTAKVPSWYKYKIETERQLYDAKRDNIHFMHLSFNTLPENKEWIMGCQCSYCKNYGRKGPLGKKYIEKEYRKLLLDPLYLNKKMPSSESDWNYYIDEKGDKYFDPFFNTSLEDPINYALRNNEPIYFLGTNFELLGFVFDFETDLISDEEL